MAKVYAALALFVVLTAIEYSASTQSIKLHQILIACISAVLAYVLFGMV